MPLPYYKPQHQQPCPADQTPIHYRLIRGSGPRPCDFMAVGEAGGFYENIEGRPFVGKSGRLLNTYLEKVGLPRHKVFVTNVYPYWTGPGDPTPTKEQIDEYSDRLLGSLLEVQPSFLLALGRTSADWFRGVPLALDICHGLPFLWRHPANSDLSVWVVPAFHPAAALRDPETSGRCFHDLRIFSLIARGLLNPSSITPRDLEPTRRYSRSRRFIITGTHPAIDTEGYSSDPYCLSVSTKAGEAQVVLAEDLKPGVLPPGMDNVILHNSMWDIPVLRAMGQEVRDDGFEDTILMARLLLLEPAGLKDLALRHCGMRLRHYEEVVGPYYRRAVVDYLRKAGEGDWGKAEAQAVKDKRTGKWKIYQPQAVGNRLKAILRDLDNPKKAASIKPADRWAKIAPSLRAPIVQALGAFPVSHPRLAPEKELIPYAAEDADATRRIYFRLQPLLAAAKLTRAYRTDLRAIPMFIRMAENGMLLDLDQFARMRPTIVRDLESASAAWDKAWNKSTHLNLASGDQVAEYLFGRLGLKPLKQTRGGTRASVDEKTLELLKDQHPSIPGILAWKKLHTNLTFVDRIPKWVCPDGRIYPNINTQGTVTGRPSTSDPNLLNVPVRSELGKQIRMGFVAPPNHRLLSIDLSQIELRIGAHLSQDPEMTRAFKVGEDLHQKTATSLGLDRYTAKTINFGIFYGMSHLRLRSELLEKGITKSEDECADTIREWFRLYKGVRGWLDGLLAKGRRLGYVRGLSGRLRYLPNLYLPIGNPLRSEAERHAGNFPVQESAGWVIKRAMWRMHRWIKAHPECQVKPLLQIYDELLFEVPKRQAKAVEVPLRALMVADAPLFSVPLLADSAIGRAWGEL